MTTLKMARHALCCMWAHMQHLAWALVNIVGCSDRLSSSSLLFLRVSTRRSFILSTKNCFPYFILCSFCFITMSISTDMHISERGSTTIVEAAITIDTLPNMNAYDTESATETRLILANMLRVLDSPACNLDFKTVP